MTLSLSAVKYIGPTMQARLESNGVTTVEQLAAMSEQALAEVPGIGANIAAGILESAKALIAKAETSVEPVVVLDTVIATEEGSESVTETPIVSQEIQELKVQGSMEQAPEAAQSVAPPKAAAAKRPSRVKTTAVKKVAEASTSSKPATTRTRAKKPAVEIPVIAEVAAIEELEVEALETVEALAVEVTAKEKLSNKQAKKAAKANIKKSAKEKRDADKQLKKAKKVVEQERKKEKKALKKLAKKEKKEKKAADKAAKKIVKKAKKAAKSAGAKLK